MRDGESSSDHMRLLNRLALMPLAEWHELAVSTPGRVSNELHHALTRALAQAATPFEVWQARDHLDTLMHRYDCAEGREMLRPLEQSGHVREVTERALLAVLVRPALREADFAVLVGSFSRGLR